VHVTQSKVNVHGRAHVQVHHDAPVFVAPNSYVSAAGRTHVNVGAGSQMRVHGRGTHVSVNPVN
jgi:D-alanine-D-alanine ligase-like ATP-grasp enzyme